MIIYVGQVVSEGGFNTRRIDTQGNGSEICDEPYNNDTVRAQCGSCGKCSNGITVLC